MREALGDGGCPVCRLAVRAAARFLDMLSYENVNDPGIRAQLRASRGLCNYHAWRFVDEADDGLGTAIIYLDIVDSLLGSLEAQGAGLRRLGDALRGRRAAADLAGRLAPAAKCLACLQLEGSARRYIDTLLAHLADAELREGYAASAGLCLPHLREALARSETSEEARLLVRPVAERLDALAAADSPAPEAVATALVGAEGALPSLAALDRARSEDRAIDAPPPFAAATASDDAACPACLGALAAGDACLRSLATVDRREDERPSESLCNRHAWRLAWLGARHGAPALWRGAVRGAAELVARLPAAAEVAPPPFANLALPFLGQRPGGPGVALAEALAEREPCPACLAEAAAERSLAKQSLRHLASAPDGGRGGQGGTLCLPHSLLALRLANGDGERAALLRTQARLYRHLAADLSEYIRKRDYRFAHEPPGAEADSPQRAVAYVAGAKGLLPFWTRGASRSGDG